LFQFREAQQRTQVEKASSASQQQWELAVTDPELSGSPQNSDRQAPSAARPPSSSLSESTNGRVGKGRPQGEAKLYEVEIGGTLLRLRSSHDQVTVDELVQLVNRKLKEAMPLTKSGSPQNASILASLHMAEEFLAWKRKAQGELDDLRRQAQALLSELESTRISPQPLRQSGLNN
jgi:cell division protein ZapA